MNDTDATETPAPMSHRKALAVLLMVVVAVAAYIAVGTALGMHKLYGGFLFITYWLGIRHADPALYAPSLAGALGGLLLAAALYFAPLQFGTAGMVAWLILILAVIYAMIVGWLPLVINIATMLFLTVATIPALQTPEEITGLLLSTVYGAVLIGAAVWLPGRLRKGRTAAPAAL